MKELYRKASCAEYLQPCPVCGSDSQLFIFSEDFKDGPVQKLVACTNSESFGPQGDDAVHPGCLLFMPPIDFYHATFGEAVKYWNYYARQLTVIRRKRNWGRHGETTIRALMEKTSLGSGQA